MRFDPCAASTETSETSCPPAIRAGGAPLRSGPGLQQAGCGHGTPAPTHRFRGHPGSVGVIAYYCIVNMPGVPVREIAVLHAGDDVAAGAQAARLAQRWPGYETIALYEGERCVAVLANPSLGFAAYPLDASHKAA